MPSNRLFVGVPVPLDTAKVIQQNLPDYNFLKRSAPENYHITLLFLGKVEDPGSIIATFKGLIFNSFLISVDGIGGFSKKGKLGILYCSISQPSDELSALNAQVKAMFPEYDNGQYSSFIPHITLCRNLKHDEAGTAESLLTFKFEQPIQFKASEVCLYDSGDFSSTRIYKKIWTERFRDY